MAREMLETGQWILPHLAGAVYADKPPLLFWSIALISALGPGVTEWTARLPTALAAVGVCFVTWRLGVRLFSPTTGLLAALVLATSGGFFWSGRQALPDMLLTLWTTGAFWALWEWFSGKRRQAAVAAGLCMGLATLTKGPVGAVLPTLCGLIYLMASGQRPKLRGWDALLCLGAFLGVTLAWFVPAVGLGGLEYAQATLLHHSLERYVRAWEHGSMVLLSCRLPGGIPAMDAIPPSSSDPWRKAGTTPRTRRGVVCSLLVGHGSRVFFHLNRQTRHLHPPCLPRRGVARGMALGPLVATCPRCCVCPGYTPSSAYTGADSLGIGCRHLGLRRQPFTQ